MTLNTGDASPIYEQVGEQSLFSRDQKYRNAHKKSNTIGDASIFSNEMLPKTKRKTIATRRTSVKKGSSIDAAEEEKLRKI